MAIFQVFVAWTPQPSPQGCVYGVLKTGITSPKLHTDNTILQQGLFFRHKKTQFKLGFYFN